MGFDQATRLRHVPLATLTKPTGGGTTQVDVPRTGLLSKIFLTIRGSVAGSLSAPNALGMASIIRRIRFTLNSGVDVFNVTGPGFFYLIQEQLEMQFNIAAQNTARNAVTATTFKLDVVIPIALNAQSAFGLIMLQNETTLGTLSIEWEADATVATGATVTATAVPTLELFDVPADREKDWPDLRFIHSFIQDDQAANSGAYIYNIPRGNTILSLAALTPSAWTRAQLRLRQSSFDYDYTPNTLETVLNSQRGYDASNLTGALTGNDKRVIMDFLASDGVGTFGGFRDTYDSSRLTDMAMVLTLSGAQTVNIVRRQMIPIG